MDAEELKSLQAPVQARPREDPVHGLVTLRARGSIEDANIVCRVETGRALATAGLHPATGGSGAEHCSGDKLLEALVACAGVTLEAVATALEFRLGHAMVSAEGDLDFRGTLGVAKDAPVGFREIRPSFVLDADESRDRIDTLFEAHRALLRRLPDDRCEAEARRVGTLSLIPTSVERFGGPGPNPRHNRLLRPGRTAPASRGPAASGTRRWRPGIAAACRSRSA